MDMAHLARFLGIFQIESMTKPAKDYRKLSIPERLELVEDIWDSIAQDADDFPLSDENKIELDRRLAAHRQDPESTIPWSAIRGELFERGK